MRTDVSCMSQKREFFDIIGIYRAALHSYDCDCVTAWQCAALDKDVRHSLSSHLGSGSPSR